MRRSWVFFLLLILLAGSGQGSVVGTCRASLAVDWGIAAKARQGPSYVAEDFPKSRFASEDRTVTEESHAAFAKHQASQANLVADLVANGHDSSRRRFWRVARGFAEKPYFSAMTTPLRATADDSYPINLRFRELAKTLRWYPEKEARALFTGNDSIDYSCRIIEPYHRFRLQLGGEIELVAPLFHTTRSGKRLPATFLVKSTTGAILWMHTLHSSDELLADAFARIDALASISDESVRLKEFLAATYAYYHSIPFRRGSARVGNRWLAGEYLAAFGRKLVFIDGLDRLAMTMPFERFFLFALFCLERVESPKARLPHSLPTESELPAVFCPG